MPCEDITEVLHISLDHDDRMASYRLVKRTCGRAVGEESLLLDWTKGVAAAELLDADIDAMFDHFLPDEEGEEFLLLKHLFALQQAVAAYLGLEESGPGAACAVASIAFGPDGAEIETQLRIDVLAEKIKGCGRCGTGCGRKNAREKIAAQNH